MEGASTLRVQKKLKVKFGEQDFLESNNKFIKNFAKEGRKLRREIMTKHKFQSSVLGVQHMQKLRQVRLINTNINQVVGPKLNLPSKFDSWRPKTLTQSSSKLLPHLQATALT